MRGRERERYRERGIYIGVICGDGDRGRSEGHVLGERGGDRAIRNAYAREKYSIQREERLVTVD